MSEEGSFQPKGVGGGRGLDSFMLLLSLGTWPVAWNDAGEGVHASEYPHTHTTQSQYARLAMLAVLNLYAF